jgi:hypothetical protein
MSRTNRSQNSEVFNNWSGGSTLVTANQAIAPDGNLTADELTKTSSFSGVGRTETLSTSVVDTVFSVFVKEDTTDRITLRVASGGNDVRRVFNLTNETSGNSGGNSIGFISDKIEKYPNGWYRVSLICTSAASTVGLNIYGGQAGNTTYDGEVYIWGSQLEEGDYITSYMPNSSTTTTRSSDAYYNSGTTADFNDSEGVLFVEMAALGTDGITKRLSVSNSGTGASYIIRIEFRPTENQIYGVIFVTGVGNVATLTHTVSDWTQMNKVAVKYKTNDFAMWINGVEVATDTLGSTSTGLGTIRLDAGNGGNSWYGNLKQLIYFNEALTDTELQTLTS